MLTTTLYACRREAVRLEQALAGLDAQPLGGLAYTPAHAALAEWRAGRLILPPGVVHDQIYEARLANEHLELRWLRNPAGAGEGAAVCLSEHALALQGWLDLEPLRVEPLPELRLPMTILAAADEDPVTGWRLANAPRHGRLVIPVHGAAAGQRLAWRLREYLGPAPDSAGADGNRVVVATRLLGITVWEDDA